jgi:RHS repeat-associated protein
MLSDGFNAFTWNARNQLSTLNNVALQYDARGRRIKNAAGTSFLFEGRNATQEFSGSSVTANTLTGATDELFQRTDSNGTVVPLTDALGSIIGLVNSSGSVATTYTYDPFGNSTTAGMASANLSQYTGRENEGNGLYYYRARYYSPVLARFVSEDPLGFAGSGSNFYTYAADAPINLIDPLGLYTGWDFLRDFGSFSEAFTDTLTFGSATRLNDALGAGSAVNRCGWAHGAGTVAGIAFSTAVGADALPDALSGLSNGAKGSIGEGLSYVENTLQGSTNLGTEVRAADLGLNLTTRFDSVWESSSGDIYYVESKFGKSGLRAAQRVAQNALGDAYHVERWSYPFFGRIGGYLGFGSGTAVAISGRSCGCK